MTARACGLHLLTARTFRQLYRWRSPLSSARSAGTTLPAGRRLLTQCVGGERRGQECHERQGEESALSHISSTSRFKVSRICGYYACWRPCGLHTERAPSLRTSAAPRPRRRNRTSASVSGRGRRGRSLPPDQRAAAGAVLFTEYMIPVYCISSHV